MLTRTGLKLYRTAWILFVILLTLPSGVQGQDSLVVGSYHFEGNKRTRDAVLMREMTLQIGQKVHPQDVEMALKESERLLGNTGLFLSIHVHTCRESSDTLNLCIRVREAWYIFPIPIFELADRNFNVWWKDFDHDLKRINYGLYVNHYNFTGWGDVLKIKVQQGYSNKYELAYDLPQFLGNKHWGLGLQAYFQRYREINYASADDRQLFYRDFGRWMLEKSHAQVHVRYRPQYRWKFSVGMNYRSAEVDPQVINDLNPAYFASRETRIQYLSLWGHVTLDQLDDRAYPFHGYSWSGYMAKEGLGLLNQRDRWWVESVYAGYLATGEAHGFECVTSGRVQLQRQNPGYFDYQALGYGNRLVRGYEHYVIDGMDYALIQAAWRIRLWDVDLPIPWPSWFQIPAFPSIPLKVYAHIHTDHGVVHDPYFQLENPLRGRWLMSAGAGLDLRFFYDKIFSLRWNINGLGENGLFLHTSFSLR